MAGEDLRYLLITSAKNEEAFIELTIQSVIRQTMRPTRWLIVSDGSTDGTDGIVRRYVQEHDWIELLRMPEREGRDFGGKARCFNNGYARIRHLPHQIIGSLDADITFEPDYFEFLLGKFADDPKLGLAGTPFAESGLTYDYRFSSIEHVSGACQLFRRECFDAVGGYVPVEGGGLDVIAVLSARMNGWRTRTFTEKYSTHHREMGSAKYRSKISANFDLGQRGYRLGFHPVWQIFRSIYQMANKPYIIAGSALFAGYCWAMAKRVERPITRELVDFQRKDQMRRLQTFFASRLGLSKS
jgi:biofilm PGA synthesis N-glycosyltransferase PgaC